MLEVVFFYLAFNVCLLALLTVISRHIFHSAIWLSLCLMNIAGIYFYLDAEFLGVIQVLVYIGGIITLFIFAIKLTARIDDRTIRQTNPQMFVPFIISIIFFFIFLKIIFLSPWITIGRLEGHNASIQELGHSLLTKYFLPFEFISILLLAAMVGAIFIGRVKK